MIFFFSTPACRIWSPLSLNSIFHSYQTALLLYSGSAEDFICFVHGQQSFQCSCCLQISQWCESYRYRHRDHILWTIPVKNSILTGLASSFLSESICSSLIKPLHSRDNVLVSNYAFENFPGQWRCKHLYNEFAWRNYPLRFISLRMRTNFPLPCNAIGCVTYVHAYLSPAIQCDVT